MKFVKLLGHAYVNGVLRSPDEGVLHLTNEEADRIVGEKLAEDVSEDFVGVEGAADAATDHITTDADGAAAGDKKAGGKAAASKE